MTMPKAIPVEITLCEHYHLLRPQLFREPEMGRVIYVAGFYDGVPFASTCYVGLIDHFDYECSLRLGEPGMRRIRKAVKEAEPHSVIEIPGDVDEASLALHKILREHCVRIYPGKDAPLARERGAAFYSEAQEWRVPRHLHVDQFTRWLEKPSLPDDVPQLDEVKQRSGQGFVAVANPAETFDLYIGARVLINDERREALFNSHGRIFETPKGQRAYIQLELL
jgi:hypothetical protein